MNYHDSDIPPMPASKVQEHAHVMWSTISEHLGQKEPMTTQPTLMDIAKALEAKWLLPEGVFSCDLCSMFHIFDNDSNIVNLSDEITYAVLRDAMTMDLLAERITGGWSVLHNRDGSERTTLDSDHNNCPTQSLYAAWCWAKEIK